MISLDDKREIEQYQKELVEELQNILPQNKPETTIDVEIKMTTNINEDGQPYYRFDEMTNFIKKLRETHSDCDVHVKISGVGF